MDTGLLNLGEEHFSTFYVYEDEEEAGPDDPNLEDSNRPYFNDWEDERELNGDIGLIPESSSFCETLKDMSEMTNSPPSVLFQKMLDWSTLIYVDGVDEFPHESSIAHPLPYQEESENVNQGKHSLFSYKVENMFDEKEIKNFDIATYLNEADSSHKVQSGGKKIDVEGQKYIVEEKWITDTNDDVDVETVSEGTSLPVLEAADAFSLLEQFEASEKPIVSSNKKAIGSLDLSDSLVTNINQIASGPMEIFEKVPRTPIDIFENEEKYSAENANSSEAVCLKQGQEPEELQISCDKLQMKVKQERKTEPATSQNYVKNKQILDALPQELIARINESGKRKTITVIPPIPNKKRGSSRSVDSLSQHRNKVSRATTNNDQVLHFDHDYCASVSPYPKEPHKDSGFQSSEEEDRSVIRNQPTVKTPDGKLMVSLLKVNTIRNVISSNNQKRKLNLEEYKKRRLIPSNATSQSSSPISSTCSSPLPEDETLKRIKHQEKLMKMAAELLSTTPAKSAGQSNVVVSKPKQMPLKKVAVVATRVEPPPDLEVKTYVSIGTNTDISTINCSKNIIESAQQLEEIKPLLQKVSDKINSNSFITSLIENIPKVKTKANNYVKQEVQETVREDKIIQYLKKDRLPVKRKTAGTQTDFDAEENDDIEPRYRRRIDGQRSPDSLSSRCTSPARRRKRVSSVSSQQSHSSCSSDSSAADSRSSRSRSRSKSRSSSPKRSRQYSAERLREVEERRVIYVGRISNGTVKDDLRRRFQQFGRITNISLHFRDYGDNYGFVTFANKEHAYEAVEHGNDGHVYPKYDLSFGGRRIFCKTTYSDLDNMREEEHDSYYLARTTENSFDALLKAAQEKIRKRKP